MREPESGLGSGDACTVYDRPDLGVQRFQASIRAKDPGELENILAIDVSQSESLPLSLWIVLDQAKPGLI